ncbi:MAG: hypothetical protein R3211_10710 [Balneolaceae bacterium]|nr:hypothetical protein [Balneolaceae bacterium]
MYYLLFLIFSMLVQVDSTVQKQQAHIDVTFETASLGYHAFDVDAWNIRAMVNEREIREGRKIGFKLDPDEALTFRVSVRGGGIFSGKQPGKILATESDGKTMYIDKFEVEDAQLLKTFGSENVEISVDALRSGNPVILHMNVAAKEEGDRLFGGTAKWVFIFKVERR